MGSGTARALVGVIAAGVAVGFVSAPAPAAGPVWVAQDVIVGSGLAASTETWEAVPVDFDNDGDQDVWIGYHDQGGKLWRNNGSGTYVQVVTAAWPKKNLEKKIPDRHDCAWADVDQNGLVDSYCAAGRGTNNPVKYGRDNELWLQQTPGQFTDVGTAWGIGDLCGRSHYVAFLDADGDPYPDLFVGNADPRVVSGDPCDNPANGLPSEQMKLLLDGGGSGFTEAPASGISGYGGARCAVVNDYNGDGWDDLFVCGIAEPAVPQQPRARLHRCRPDARSDDELLRPRVRRPRRRRGRGPRDLRARPVLVPDQHQRHVRAERAHRRRALDVVGSKHRSR